MFSSQSDFGLTGHGSPGGSEPMTLGSPKSGSVSPAAAAGGGASYLPAYLIGDSTSGIAPASSSLWISPNKKHHSSLSPSQTSPTKHVRHGSFCHSQPSRSFINRPTAEKAGGPPIQGLFDTATSPLVSGLQKDIGGLERTRFESLNMTPTNTGVNHFSGILTPSKILNQSNVSMSPAQIDPFYTQGEALTPDDHLDETWVTVFGFPPAATSYILQQFSQYGSIINHKIASSGNWMHVHYQSKLQAKKALSKNGKVFGGSIMIGVKPCIEKNMMDDSTKENFILNNSLKLDNCESVIVDKSNRLANIRPLTQAYRTATSDHEVTPQNRTPQKANNVMTKAMEYIFSW